MSKQFEITVTATVAYKPNAEHYPEGSSWDDMLEMDIAAADDNPFFFMDQEETEWSVEGEIQSFDEAEVKA
ncbi:hypothetical protein [Prauserella endophytica]|uniref:Uncharacterized protein n=1 Tax=Prauserella endophytica TaxID=1592324 RepID=A0ABY2S095_9PSEU|nr:hypothetical protein [Prauserella endophytica]TKG67050.1 hypothetical protein FCN18_24400 [Prauserella endophytica]